MTRFELDIWNAWLMTIPFLAIVICMVGKRKNIARRMSDMMGYTVREKVVTIFASLAPYPFMIATLWAPLSSKLLFLCLGLIFYLIGLALFAASLKAIVKAPHDELFTTGPYRSTGSKKRFVSLHNLPGYTRIPRSFKVQSVYAFCRWNRSTGGSLVRTVALIAEKLMESGTVFAVDLSEGMLAEARQRLERLGIHNVRFMKREYVLISLATGSTSNKWSEALASKLSICGREKWGFASIGQTKYLSTCWNRAPERLTTMQWTQRDGRYWKRNSLKVLLRGGEAGHSKWSMSTSPALQGGGNHSVQGTPISNIA
jgi:hypothetical protein